MSQISKLLENKTATTIISASVVGFALAKTISVATLGLTASLPTLRESLDKKNVFENYKLSEKFALSSKLENTASVQNWKLRAILKSNTMSFIIFDDSGKTVFLSFQDTYNGYKLEDISNDKVKFTNGGASFELKIDKKDGSSVIQPGESTSKAFSLSRSEYKRYAANPGMLADEVNAKQTNFGLIITELKNNSLLSHLGIKQNDIITDLNGKKVSNITDIMTIFTNPDKIKSLNIIIKRQNLKKELNYEIN